MTQEDREAMNDNSAAWDAEEGYAGAHELRGGADPEPEEIAAEQREAWAAQQAENQPDETYGTAEQHAIAYPGHSVTVYVDENPTSEPPYQRELRIVCTGSPVEFVYKGERTCHESWIIALPPTEVFL